MSQATMKMFEFAQFLRLKLGLAKYGLQATSPAHLPVFVNEVLLELGMLKT